MYNFIIDKSSNLFGYYENMFSIHTFEHIHIYVYILQIVTYIFYTKLKLYHTDKIQNQSIIDDKNGYPYTKN